MALFLAGSEGSIIPLTRKRLAIIVSHPIQYHAPLYQRLASRDDLVVKVFFTWHSGQTAVEDRGFRMPIAWDIRLTEGYDFELVPNISSEPGTHHFRGLRNPSLVERVKAWNPDAIQVTGSNWQSHFLALRAFSKMGTPSLFRGNSHLLDARKKGVRWRIKRAILKRVFSWPTGFLVVGAANRHYYETFGVKANRLFRCPHSIDVARLPSQRIATSRKQEYGVGTSKFRMTSACYYFRENSSTKSNRSN